MKYLVAIDWKTGYKYAKGITYIELSAKTKTRAMIEAPKVAFRHGVYREWQASGANWLSIDGMVGISFLRIFTQTPEEKENGTAKDCSVIYYPQSHEWCNDKYAGEWYV